MPIGGNFVNGGQSDQLLSMLSILADPEKFKERLSQLQAAEKSAADMVALAGPADEIVALRAKAQQQFAEAANSRALADGALLKAQSDSRQIVDEAERRGKEIIAKASAEAESIVLMANKTLEKAAAESKLLFERESDLARLEVELDRRLSELNAKEVDLKEREDQLAVRRANFLEAQQSLTNLIKE